MIGRIRGELIEIMSGMVLIEANGIGYEVEVPLSTASQFEGLNQQVVLHIQMIVREDAQLLYGFYSLNERDLFRSLIKVNGVGPKLAVAILSGMDCITFAQSVLNKDVNGLVALPGVGKKTAERLIVEMKDRLPKMDQDLQQNMLAVATNNIADAEAALIGLGYKPQEAARVLAKLETNDQSVADLIKQGLKALS
ncbi:MAG: Holliday junction branch migration protein RuvA [Pseudomonadales bacterium]|nr:Holliday junction branch migration protein RuvA [Pseudomonadales bacterium]